MRQLIVQGGGGFLMEKSRVLDRHFLARDRQAESARLLHRKRQRRRGVGALQVLRGDGHARLPRHASVAVPAADVRPGRIRAGAGRDLRRRRQHALAARAVARMGARHRAARGVRAGRRAGRHQRGHDLLVRVRHHGLDPGPLSPLRCLGWLPGTACPHYDGEAERRPAFHRMLAAGRIPPGYAADDGAALHFVDESLAEVVVSKPGATAYRLAVQDDAVVETALPARSLA